MTTYPPGPPVPPPLPHRLAVLLRLRPRTAVDDRYDTEVDWHARRTIDRSLGAFVASLGPPPGWRPDPNAKPAQSWDDVSPEFARQMNDEYLREAAHIRAITWAYQLQPYLIAAICGVMVGMFLWVGV